MVQLGLVVRVSHFRLCGPLRGGRRPRLHACMRRGTDVARPRKMHDGTWARNQMLAQRNWRALSSTSSTPRPGLLEMGR